MIDRKQLKLFGERNTGTNYITGLIRQNFDVRILSDGPPYWWEKRFGLGALSMNSYSLLTSWRSLGWKHSAPNIASHKLHHYQFVTVTKNPYSWLLSLHKRPYHNWAARNLSFTDFLRTPWPLMLCDGVERKSVTPVELWNIKNRSYLSLVESAPSALLIRYEDVLRSPDDFLQRLSLLIERPLKTEITLQEKGAKSADAHKSYDDYRNYYVNELWRDKLSSNDITYINQSLDTELMQKLRYEFI